ncbi:MAG TPA: LysR family transcriptional regulator [Pseudomonadales bacterium]
MKMDTELARTFLTVVASGNFSAAAARLFVTQSTVSTRIAALEDQLGCRLFVRNKGGAVLTPQGRWFQAHATTLVRTVERVRQEIGVPRGFAASVTIGGRLGLWESLLLALLPRVRQEAPDVALRSEIGFEDELMQGLLEGRLDIGVMYAPHQRPGLVVEPLFEETLVYVSTVPDAATVPEEGYVYVDWGPEFAARHSATFPDYPGAALSVNVGWLGLQHILAHGGAGYFPLRLVGDALARSALHRRRDVPGFTLPAYVVHPTEPDDPTAKLVDLVRSTAQQLGGRGVER